MNTWQVVMGLPRLTKANQESVLETGYLASENEITVLLINKKMGNNV